MMYLIFNNDGSIKTLIVGESIQQGNNLVNTIFISVDGYDPEEYSCIAQFVLPNGEIGTSLNGTIARNELVNNVLYNGYKVTLTQAQTMYPGTLKSAFKILDLNSHTLFTYEYDFLINPTDAILSETMISSAQYNALVQSLLSYATKTYVDQLVSEMSGVDIGRFLQTYNYDQAKWDTTPTENSTKPVTSGGIYNAIKNKTEEYRFTGTTATINTMKLETGESVKPFFAEYSRVVRDELFYICWFRTEQTGYQTYTKFLWFVSLNDLVTYKIDAETYATQTLDDTLRLHQNCTIQSKKLVRHTIAFYGIAPAGMTFSFISSKQTEFDRYTLASELNKFKGEMGDYKYLDSGTGTYKIHLASVLNADGEAGTLTIYDYEDHTDTTISPASTIVDTITEL